MGNLFFNLFLDKAQGVRNLFTQGIVRTSTALALAGKHILGAEVQLSRVLLPARIAICDLELLIPLNSPGQTDTDSIIGSCSWVINDRIGGAGVVERRVEEVESTVLVVDVVPSDKLQVRIQGEERILQVIGERFGQDRGTALGERLERVFASLDEQLQCLLPDSSRLIAHHVPRGLSFLALLLTDGGKGVKVLQDGGELLRRGLIGDQDALVATKCSHTGVPVLFHAKVDVLLQCRVQSKTLKAMRTVP